MCSECPWLKRLLCVLACPAVNEILARIDDELRAKGL